MTIKSIDALTLKKWMDLGEAYLVDVREISEYKEAHIPGAKLIPLATVTKEALGDFTGKKLVFQCRSGQRSKTACEKILDEGVDRELFNLTGGILGWSQAGYPIEK